MLKAVFIDLDGTLIDSLPFLYNSYCAFLENFGLRGTEKEFQELSGPSMPHVVNKLRLTHHLKIPAEELLSNYYAILNKATTDDLPLVAGAENAVEKLHELGLQLVVVSSAHRDYARRLLISHGLGKYFALIVAPELVENVSKPHPRIYEYALDQMRLKPDEVIAVEDSINGVKAAIAAGIQTLHFKGSPSKNDMVIPLSNWNQILEYIEKNYAKV